MHRMKPNRYCTALSVSFSHSGFRFSERMDRFLG